MKKKKFKPVITRVKLNPEQAVLACGCYHSGVYTMGSGSNPDFCDASYNRMRGTDEPEGGAIGAS